MQRYQKSIYGLLVIFVLCAFIHAECFAQGNVKAEASEIEISAEVIAAAKNLISLRRAIDDLGTRFGEQYDAAQFRKKLDEFETRFAQVDFSQINLKQQESISLLQEFAKFRREVLLANPLIDFDTLLFRRAEKTGLVYNWYSNCARGKHGYGNKIVSAPIKNMMGETQIIAEPPRDSFIGDICLNWDAQRFLVTALSERKTWQIFECATDGTGILRQVTPEIGDDVDSSEGVYLPDGGTIFISTAQMLGVPCIDGVSPVGNLFRLEADGKTVRQLTFEQDQDWSPVVREDGTIMYQRWEYTDTSHYFTRLLFTMNPDGTKQSALYGTNSFWPNSIFYARQIPNAPTMFAGIVTGHHGVSREGELVVFDTARGFRETDGVVQRIPGFGKKVEPLIMDELVNNSWPKFLFPQPLDANYYLVSARMTSSDSWGIYLVDVFDNMLKLREEPGFHLLEPTPLKPREIPPVIPQQVNLAQDEAQVFISDIYLGDGLKGIPRGTVKKLRLFAYGFAYRDIGGHDYLGMESCWDTRHIIGEVPVYADGSAAFSIPANTPLALQPLDDEGRALQIMRTWFIGMPGESVSCIGCHEDQNMVAPRKQTIAMGKSPVAPQPFFGELRPFSFHQEIQPILDKYCVGCHDGTAENSANPNFADLTTGYKGFSKSYHALHPFVRRPGPESDAHLLKPMEYHASTSELFQLLERGHHGVQLDEESSHKLYCWADLNVPYFGTWLEVANAYQRGNMPQSVDGREPKNLQRLQIIANRSMEMRRAYGGINYDPEAKSYFAPPKERPEFVAPLAPEPIDRAVVMHGVSFGVPGIDKPVKQTLQVGEVSFDLVPIQPGIFALGDENGERNEFPRHRVIIDPLFWMMTTEVTNALYHEFDSKHDSRYIDQWWKDHTLPGYPHNLPQQPVIRVTWREAVVFAEWLSQKTGKKFRLPTEAEWEYACRADSTTPMWFGNCDSSFAEFENLADDSLKLFVVRGVNPQPMRNPPDAEAFLPRASGENDGKMISGNVASYKPNTWGLYDMHGNVCEWTLSDFVPYPYPLHHQLQDERNAGNPNTPKVVRGGSWQDRPQNARSGRRISYAPWQPIHNVGFRLVMEAE